MNSDHGRLRRLVLGCEDLEGSLRDEALAHLEECAECRRVREAVLAAEAVIRSVEPLPETEPVADRAAEASLAALLGTVRRKRFRTFPVVPLALAAVLVLVVLVPRAPRLGQAGPVRDLQVGSPLVFRGESPAGTDLRHGVSFRLDRPGYPVLVHVDGAGNARLLYPLPGPAPAPYPGGETVFLPPPGASGQWRGSLAPGCETYLLAVADADAPPDAGALAPFLFKAPSGPRREAVQDLRHRLEQAFGNAVACDDPECL